MFNKTIEKHQFLEDASFGSKFRGFQNLMGLRIRDVLLVSSPYDLYLFEEDGRLYEMIRQEYQELQLSHSPELTRASNSKDAIKLAKEKNRFELIITTMHIEDTNAFAFVKKIKKLNLSIPVVLLVNDNRELKQIITKEEHKLFDKIFMWQGDFKIIIAIIKYFEDRMNIEHDTEQVGVQNIIVIEDNIRYYSSFMPLIYTEILNQARRLIAEGSNLTQRFLRVRARPKILLCSTYEEASSFFRKYKNTTLGIISDIAFPRKNELDHKAGIRFAKKVKKTQKDIPILLLSDEKKNRELANNAECSFIVKNSPTLLNELRHFMIEYFSFGDFVFRNTEGREVGRAANLKNLKEQLAIVSSDSIAYHSMRNHFSNWLKARSEFWLAHKLRPRQLSDYISVEDLRKDLINSISDYSNLRQRGIISEFIKEAFDPKHSFARIGGGSLGGKARGLGFTKSVINNYSITEKFDEVKIFVPPAVVVATDIFDYFVDENNLREFALNIDDDEKILQQFLNAQKFPNEIISRLNSFLELIDSPLAIRSSSLLEDSQYHPFAGVYKTYMLPNNNPNLAIRLEELLIAIKKVYASTFFKGAKQYIKFTSYRLEEEKMAVIIQKMVGNEHDNRFYPDFSGVAKSYNFYPIAPEKSDDGVVNIAIGLGKTVVDGGSSVRFCPKYPTDLVQFYSVKESFNNSQKDFYALNLKKNSKISSTDICVNKFGLDIAEQDGTLNYTGSTYSVDNDAIYDGLSRVGPRLVTFAPILRNRVFPIAQILDLLLKLGKWGMGVPIEIEFAANVKGEDNTKEFGILQIRPLVVEQDVEDIDLIEPDKNKIVCESSKVLGTGIIKDIKDIVLVDYNKFERSNSREVAKEVAIYNNFLMKLENPYLLIAVGRLGTLDPWLGIPVEWEHISGAKVIIEAGMKDFDVTPSQGSHFFQNLTSFEIGYFTISYKDKNSFVDWDWLLNCKIETEKKYTRHIKLEKPLLIKMNGKTNKGIILKPNLK